MITCAFEDGSSALLRHVVVDTIVLKDNKILLVKRTKKLLEGGKWGLVGGYVERDETNAQAAAREIMEETGWQIKNLILLTINDNPDRPNEDHQNISLVYFCEATQKTGEADWESDEQKWFDMNEIPDESIMAFDHTKNINIYKRYVSENLTLPILD
jgi:ADP-ribose pyrophosphatase YjhB (NUDIX family)